MEALDRETLARARGAGEKSAAPGQSIAPRLSGAQQSSAGRVPSGSVAEARNRRAAEVAAMQVDAIQTLKRAREATAAGKTNAAAVFYRMAAKQATGDLKSQIDREAAAVARDSRGEEVARSSRHPSTSTAVVPGKR